MPSARPSAFRGSGGILRDVDGTIVGIKFTDENPFGQPKPGAFQSLFAILDIQADGAETARPQPIFVGGAEDFGITDDARGLTGEGQISRGSGWYVFLSSLMDAGFDESVFPDDDPLTADYSALVGARCRFNWTKNEKVTKKYGGKPRLDKNKKPMLDKDGKPVTYDREDLIVTNYYGQAAAAPISKAALAISKAAPAAAKAVNGKKAAPAVVDVSAMATDRIILALSAATDTKLSKSKLSVKLLTACKSETEETRAAVQAWAKNDANLAALDGVTFDPATQTLSLEA